MHNKDNLPDTVAHDLSAPSAFSAASDDNDQAFPILPFDPENYMAHIAHLNISDEQAHAFLSALWHIMHSIVDLGIGLDSVPLPILPKCAKLAQDKHSDLDSISQATQFNHTAQPKTKG